METKVQISLVALKDLMQKTCCNHKKIGTTSNVGPTICISVANERKTQARWVVVVRQKMQR
jgi:hypothetical protein